MTNKIRYIHFKNFNHIALTIATQESESFPDHYYVGMALAHKNDNGNKVMGRMMSAGFIPQAMELESKIKPYSPCPIVGDSGCYIIKGRENVKLIMRYLRMIERCETQSRKNSIFHQTFFTLHALFSRRINHWDGEDIRKAEVQLGKFIKDIWVDEKGVLHITRHKGQEVIVSAPVMDVTFI